MGERLHATGCHGAALGRFFKRLPVQYVTTHHNQLLVDPEERWGFRMASCKSGLLEYPVRTKDFTLQKIQQHHSTPRLTGRAHGDAVADTQVPLLLQTPYWC